MKKLNVIITGATGMVGEGVLHMCINDDRVGKILVIGRQSCEVAHSKVSEHIRDDFYDFSDLASQLAEYDACFFCLGISSVGVKEDRYTRITYDITMALANTLASQRPDATFCYVSGAGTDSSEKGRSMWARVKGRTENSVIQLFPHGYAFRPGYIQPIKGMKNTYRVYKFLAPLYPFWKAIAPTSTCRLSDIGTAMITTAITHPDMHVLTGRDITSIAAQNGQA